MNPDRMIAVFLAGVLAGGGIVYTVQSGGSGGPGGGPGGGG
ncbi:MAG: Tim44 domain-containing protein, partial [Deltaproteobacteria bacterium]|nr:Tim44 domain-containing protein [Deltaproteobacteria bacterium]